jgi:hypothetical protein
MGYPEAIKATSLTSPCPFPPYPKWQQNITSTDNFGVQRKLPQKGVN